MNHEATINFNGAEINLSKEYHEARNMMGDKRMDLDTLYNCVSHIYICIPSGHDEWAKNYLMLMDEIQKRQDMIFHLKLNKLAS